MLSGIRHPHYNDGTWALKRLKSPATQLSFKQLVHAMNKVNIKASHYWSFARGIHRWPVDSPHKGPAIGKAFLFYDVIMMVSRWATQDLCVLPNQVVRCLTLTRSPCISRNSSSSAAILVTPGQRKWSAWLGNTPMSTSIRLHMRPNTTHPLWYSLWTPLVGRR